MVASDERISQANEVVNILSEQKQLRTETLTEEAEQHQSRDYLDDTVPKKYNKRSKNSKYNEIESLFMQWAYGSAPVGEVKRFVRDGKLSYYKKTENGCVELSRTQYEERKDFDVKNIDGRAEREISEVVNSDENSEGGQIGHNYGNRDTGGASDLSGHSVGEQLRSDIGAGVRGGSSRNSRAVMTTDSDTDNTQYQLRTETLTDEEILQYAASNVTVNPAFNDFNEGEKTALGIFQKRIEVLAELKEKRAELIKMDSPFMTAPQLSVDTVGESSNNNIPQSEINVNANCTQIIEVAIFLD